MDQMYSVLDQNTVSYSIKFVLILRLKKSATDAAVSCLKM